MSYGDLSDVSESLSARRVWIEISGVSESPLSVTGHSPRGGCGLKYSLSVCGLIAVQVTLREEGVD